jgi:hypothetical protein
MSGSTGDVICKVQKIEPTMSPAGSLAVHAFENRTDKNTWQTGSSTRGLELRRLHRRYDLTLSETCRLAKHWGATEGKGSRNFRLARERLSDIALGFDTGGFKPCTAASQAHREVTSRCDMDSVTKKDPSDETVACTSHV